MKQTWICIILLPCMLAAKTPILQKIALFGNRTTKSHVILRELSMQAGDPVTDSLLISDRAWLIRSDFLDKIDFQLKPGYQNNECHLLIVVQEKRCWSFSPSFHTDDLFGMYGGGTFKLRNLWGRRHKISLKIETGGKKRIRLMWENPWLAGSWRLFSSMSLYAKEISYPYPDYPLEFLDKTWGVELKLGKQIARHIRYGLHVSWENIQTDLPAVNLSGRNSDEPVLTGLFCNVDTRDWPDYPRHGYFLYAGADYTNISNHQYAHAILNLRNYFPIKRNDILAVQWLIQGFQGDIPIYKRLHLGGGDTVRGIPTGLLAGDRFVMANVEYRFPIMYERNFKENVNLGYGGVLFFDLGSAWFSREPWTLDDCRSALGIGIHGIWDHYVVRGEYGTHGKGWGFINIGTSVHF
ncbi:BamA/TamA family outer membrane protein [bacterium]|nr:BamA/TamA family outer membrane protein [bacterium]